MKSIGCVRRTDIMNRLVLPKNLTRTMDIPVGTPLEIFTDGSFILLKKYSPGCVFCDGLDGVTQFKNLSVCSFCKNEVKKKF